MVSAAEIRFISRRQLLRRLAYSTNTRGMYRLPPALAARVFRRRGRGNSPCSDVIFDSLMTTSGAAGSLVRNAAISPMHATSLWRRTHLPSAGAVSTRKGAAVALQDCFVETDGSARLPTATRIDRVGAQHPGRERTAAQRETRKDYRGPVKQQNQHVPNGEEC
jgi:hypothetical protein